MGGFPVPSLPPEPGDGSSPRAATVPVLSLAALAVSLALQAGDCLPSTGVTPGFVCLLHIPEQRRWRHPWLPAPPASLLQLCLAGLRKIPDFGSGAATGNPPILWQKPGYPHQELGTPFPARQDLLMPAQGNPCGMQSGGLGLSLISQGTPREKVCGLFYALHLVWASVILWMCPGSPSHG